MAAEEAEESPPPSKRARHLIKKTSNQPVRIPDLCANAVSCKRCPLCKIHLHGPNANNHPNAHTEGPKKSFLCAICGIVMQKASGRNLHERNQHGFIRDEAEKDTKAVVRIRTFQLAQLFNVGRNLVVVQRTAVLSRGPQAGEYANEEDLQAIVYADPQGVSCSNAKKNGGQKPERRIFYRRTKTGACKRCLKCDIHLHGRNTDDHQNAHTENRKKPFRCAVCGIYAKKSSGRNVHEKTQHGFIRHKAEANTKAVVKIRKSQLAQLFNVGRKVAKVQRTADTPLASQADEYATKKDLQAIVHADPQGGTCPTAKKNGVQKLER
ncbi:hypothetical protein M3Y99_01335600 [Aphelenchoides fujianensis]|nr:hypothetical protein M3Y99_01335600 [Aphelenchoides fujianensis]